MEMRAEIKLILFRDALDIPQWEVRVRKNGVTPFWTAVAYGDGRAKGATVIRRELSKLTTFEKRRAMARAAEGQEAVLSDRFDEWMETT